jgi:mannitol-1-phosphate 5-dehydrogenase
MRKAVQFGAGNIGRGFLGQLYFESGYHTTFIDVAAELVDGLNRDAAYPLRIVGDANEDIRIERVAAIHGADTSAVARAVADADIASTAVGVNVLAKIAPALAAGLAQRFAADDAPPLDIIICENLLNAGPYLREQVRACLAPEYHQALDTKAGFVEASIGRMVPVMTGAQKAEHPLLVMVEPYCELPVDKQAFKGPIPPIKHLAPREKFAAYVERKLFVHNASHAATAYLGYLRGHEFIYQAIADPWVRRRVDGAMDESCEAMSRRHALPKPELWEHWQDLARRYANRGLADQVARVASDPVRKLGPNDRLIGAARMCLEHEVTPEYLALAVAAAIRYDHSKDAAARQLQRIREGQGLDGVLRDTCQLDSDSPLASLIRNGDLRLRQERVARAEQE